MTEETETKESLLAELNEFSRLLAQLHEAREESRRAEEKKWESRLKVHR